MGANGVVPQNDDASPLTEPEAEPVVEPKAEPEVEPEAAPRSTEREADPLSSSNNHGLENDMDKLNVSDNKPEADTCLLDTSDEEPKRTIIDDINDYIAEPETNASDAEANDSDAKANDSDAKANNSDAEANEAAD